METLYQRIKQGTPLFRTSAFISVFSKISNASFVFRWTNRLLVVLLLLACRSESGNTENAESVSPVVGVEVIAEGLTAPLGVLEAPDDSGRLFIFDQAGVIYLVSGSGELQSEPYLDLSEALVSLSGAYDERGLLGMAFHPEFAENSKFYVHYNLPPNSGGPGENSTWNNKSRIAEFRQSDANPDSADRDSETVILEVDQPQMNHQGGSIAFGPDGYLYIGLGDGGASNDLGPGHAEDWYKKNGGGNGQDITENLLGSILRIDVDSGEPYTIPEDNPFVGKDGLDEIYAYGFRNPYIFSFDMEGDHRLFAGDVGQVLYEEVNIVSAGGNYGWSVMEGRHCFNADDNVEELADCPKVDVYGNELIEPIIELKNTNHPDGGETLSVIGGFVYRGTDVPAFSGKYVFSSFSKDMKANGALYVTQPINESSWNYTKVDIAMDTGKFKRYVKGMGQDLKGEIYLTTSTILGPTGNTGVVYKLVNR